MSLTESSSLYDDLENMTTGDLLAGINTEDHKVAPAVKKVLPAIERLIDAAFKRMSDGGRLFYLGAGTSGRLGIVDASECPPTFGVDHGIVIGIIAGGDGAIRKAVEFAEDDPNQAWKDIETYFPTQKDTIVGIAASGKTPYVVGGVAKARSEGLLTACICCNAETPLAEAAEFPIEVLVGPEFVTGSTRMKAGTAQKMTLNLISTSLMIKLGHVKGNKMVDMQLSNNKLVDRAVTMVINELKVSENTAKNLLEKYGSVRKVLANYRVD